jgi:hypothetical protein
MALLLPPPREGAGEGYRLLPSIATLIRNRSTSEKSGRGRSPTGHCRAHPGSRRDQYGGQSAGAVRQGPRRQAAGPRLDWPEAVGGLPPSPSPACYCASSRRVEGPCLTRHASGARFRVIAPYGRGADNPSRPRRSSYGGRGQGRVRLPGCSPGHYGVGGPQNTSQLVLQ